MPSSPNGPCSDREDDVGAEQAARRRAAPPRAPSCVHVAVARDAHVDDLVAGLAQARRAPPRREAARRRARTSARRQDRDPHAWRGGRGGVVGVGRRRRVVGGGSWACWSKLPDGDRHRASRLGLLAAPTGSGEHDAVLVLGRSTSCVVALRLEARVGAACRTASARLSPVHVGHRRPASGSLATVSVTVEPCGLRAGRRVLADSTVPGSLVGRSCS